MNDDYVYLALVLFPFISLTIFALLVVTGPPSWSPFFLTAGAFSLPSGLKGIAEIRKHGVHNDR